MLSGDEFDENWRFNGIAEPYVPDFFDDPYSVTVPVGTTIMELIIYFLDEALWDPEDEKDPTYISNVIVSSSTLPGGKEGVPDWLEGLRFHGSCIDGPYWEFVTHGVFYTEDMTGKDTPMYVMWIGSGWLVMIGSPNNPNTTPGWSGVHGAGIPNERLDEIYVKDIPLTYNPETESDERSITMCYATQEVPIDHSVSENEHGETVHTLAHAHDKK
jgi:hypothetical protein